MGSTSIDWATDVWNPIVGCTKVGPGCLNCYAESFDRRFHRRGPFIPWTVKAQREAGQPAVTLYPHRLTEPLEWRSTNPARRIFVGSISDPLHPDVPWEYLAQMFATVVVSPQHYYLFLTKRPERAPAILDSPLFINEVACEAVRLGYQGLDGTRMPWPPRNVWFGCSVENQRWANLRRKPMEVMHDLGWITWVSYEPALEPVDWTGWEWLDWMVSGGESGPRARPSHPDCHRQARFFCDQHDIRFFFKQWGNLLPTDQEDAQGGYYGQPGPELDYVKLSKDRAGYCLDGFLHREFPRVYDHAEIQGTGQAPG